MPISFQQPSPMSASTAIGAGRADINAKEFSALAGLVESYGRLAAQAYGGGRGGGGGYGASTGGQVQVLPTSDYGGLAQVEGQANREQQSNLVGFTEGQRNQRLQYELAPENDPVARHITQQENFQTQRDQQNRAAMQAEADRRNAASRGGQPGASGGAPDDQGQPVEWSSVDQRALDTAKQTLFQADVDMRTGKLTDPDAIAEIRDKTMAQLNTLNQKKQAATQSQQQQQQQAKVIMAANDAALGSTHTQYQVQGGAKVQMPGIQTPDNWVPNGKGGLVNTNEAQQKYERQFNLDQAKAKVKPDKEEKEIPTSTLAREAEAEARMGTKLTGDHAKDTVAIHEKAQDIFNRRVSEQQQIRETKAQERRMKEANPEVVKAFESHVATIPQQDGQFDFNRASPEQLGQLDMYYAHPKQAGIDPAKAVKARAKIAQIIRDRNTPPPIVTPPPVARSFNTPEMLNTETGLGSRYR